MIKPLIRKTEWIDGKHKPVRKGVYETKASASLSGAYQYWDGKHWCAYAFDPYTAHSYKGTNSSYQDEQWRGLTKPASK